MSHQGGFGGGHEDRERWQQSGQVEGSQGIGASGHSGASASSGSGGQQHR